MLIGIVSEPNIFELYFSVDVHWCIRTFRRRRQVIIVVQNFEYSFAGDDAHLKYIELIRNNTQRAKQ